MKISDHNRYRFYETLPGISIWGTLIACVTLSFTKPLWMIYFIIVFDVYWVLRVIYFAFYLLLSWRRFRRAAKIDWMSKLCDKFAKWEEKINVVFVPFCNENWQVVDDSLKSIVNSTYPSEKIYLVLSGEQRYEKNYERIKKKVEGKYSRKFVKIFFYIHPDNLPEEVPGKGSNINYAEKQFKLFADRKNWNYKNIIASIFDVDTVVHSQYFAHLTYLYCSHPRPHHSSFQPLTLYNNNIWESPSILRVMAFGTSFWILFSLARLDNLVTFSSHSMSFQAIVDCKGHEKNIVSEDSRIFYQCWLRYDGDYEVTPMYIPVSMDTVREKSVWKSLKNLYYQQRRWAWGTEHIPYLLWKFRSNKRISFKKKFIKLFCEWEGKWSWAVVAIIITLMGQLPLYVINYTGGQEAQSTLYFSTPSVLQVLMTISMLGLMISAILGMLVLPRRPGGYSPHRYLYMVFQWLLLPVSLIVFSAIPCISAVTRLMLGKYLGFNVSVKERRA
ncbi:MAG: glycosyltransferase family 2 protein [bacterium]